MKQVGKLAGGQWLAGSAIGVLVAMAPGIAFAQEAGEGVKDIIVTAQKREQRLQDVPVAVSAVTTETLQTNRIANVRDLDAMVPSLTIRTVVSGSGLPAMTLRGDNSIGAAPGSDRGVAVYIDGVYYGASSGSLIDVADIERIEVLRGPQGTLFGRNSTGGAISISTANPTGNFGFRQEVTVGNYNQLRTRTRLETPQFGPFSAIVNYTHNERNGDIRNLGGGTEWDFSQVTGGKTGGLTSPKRLGDRNGEAVAVALRIEASPDFEINYKYDYNTNRDTPEGVGIVGLAPVFAGPGEPLISAYPLVPNTTPITTKRPKAVNNNYTQVYRYHTFGHNVTLDLNVNDSLSLKNIAAFRKTSSTTSGNNLDGMGGFFLPGGIPFVFLPSSNVTRAKQYSDELQLNYTSDLFDAVVGAVYFEQTTKLGGFGTGESIYQFAAMPGFVVPDTGAGDTTVKIRALAAFGQAEVHVTDSLDLVLGARITRDKKTGTDYSITGTVVPILYKKTKPTFNVGLNYKLNDDVLAYAKFSTGFISGGQLGTLVYDPQTAKSWEAGIKADWLDRKLRTNLALYYVEYGALQLATSGRSIALGIADPVLAAEISKAAQVLVNQGDARAWGVELETTAKPVQSITLGTNVGYTNFKFTSFEPIVAGAGNIYPILRPEWTVNLSAQYESPEFGDGLSIMLRADANMKSKVIATGALTPDLLDAATVPATWIVNGRAAFRGIRIGDAEFEVAAWVRNLTDDDHVTYAANLNFVIPAAYERARTYGLDLTLEF